MGDDRTTRLIAELQGQLGLSDPDAWRSAFVVLAYSKGWTKARIARHLGVTRARVGQRIDKCYEYASGGDFPVLTEALRSRPRRQIEEEVFPVEMTVEQWNDPVFAQEMLSRVG